MDNFEEQSKIQQQTESFQQQLGGYFHDLFKAAGVALPPYCHERFKSTGQRMVTLIRTVAKFKAIQVVTRLQDAVGEAFDKVETELGNVQTLALAHQGLIGDLVTGQKDLEKKVEELKKLVDEIDERTGKRKRI